MLSPTAVVRVDCKIHSSHIQRLVRPEVGMWLFLRNAAVSMRDGQRQLLLTIASSVSPVPESVLNVTALVRCAHYYRFAV